MSNEKYVLTIDFGTQSVRSIIFDKAGETIGKVKIAFEQPYFSLQPGWAEQEPEFYWGKLCEATLRLKEKCPEAFDKVGAVAVTTIRDTITFLDKTGKPLRPFLLWLDERECARVEEAIPLHMRFLFSLVGMMETACENRRITRCNWVHENEPEVWKNTYKVAQLSGYLTFKLTNIMVDSVASQIGHIPIDYKNKKWMGKGGLTACLYDIEPHMNMDLVPAGTIVGGITKEASLKTGIKEGIPFVATGSDKGCETLGNGTVGDDVASISFGTTSTVQISTVKYVEPKPFIPAYPAIIDNMYNPEIEIYRGFWMISWYKNNFACGEEEKAKAMGVSIEQYMDMMLDITPAGNEGLVLHPSWSPGLMTPSAKGIMVGFSDVHTKAHVYRAIVEGVGLGLLEGIRQLEKASKFQIKRVMASGGGSNSDRICKVMADIFGLPVQKTQTYENSALGAALTAYKGIGVFKTYDEAIKSMVHITKEYKPDMKNHARYEELYRTVYKKIYPKTKKLSMNIREYNRKINNNLL